MSIDYADQSDWCDLTERAAFSIGSGSVKVRKYSNYLVQFRFALCDFEKCCSGSVKVRQNLRKNRFIKLLFGFGSIPWFSHLKKPLSSILLIALKKAVASQKLFMTRSSNINIVCCASFLKSQNYPA